MHSPNAFYQSQSRGTLHWLHLQQLISLSQSIYKPGVWLFTGLINICSEGYNDEFNETEILFLKLFNGTFQRLYLISFQTSVNKSLEACFNGCILNISQASLGATSNLGSGCPLALIKPGQDIDMMIPNELKSYYLNFPRALFKDYTHLDFQRVGNNILKAHSNGCIFSISQVSQRELMKPWSDCLLTLINTCSGYFN